MSKTTCNVGLQSNFTERNQRRYLFFKTKNGNELFHPEYRSAAVLRWVLYLQYVHGKTVAFVTNNVKQISEMFLIIKNKPMSTFFN